MPGYPINMAAHAPCRSLADYRTELRGERIMLLLTQLQAETAGDDAEAADCIRRLRVVDARLREIEEAGGV